MPDLRYKPEDLESISNGTKYWIINDQFNVEASYEIINDPTVKKMIKKHFRTWKCFVVWTLDTEKP